MAILFLTPCIVFDKGDGPNKRDVTRYGIILSRFLCSGIYFLKRGDGWKFSPQTSFITLGVQIIVRHTIINFRIFSQPYFLIWDSTIINLEMNEI